MPDRYAKGATVLIVEDEFITGADLERRLKKMGFVVPGIADTGRKAIGMAGTLRPDIVLMDITLKEEMTGITAAKEIRGQFGIPVILLTAHADDETVGDALLSEPYGYLVKPVDDRSLRTTIQMALYKHAMEIRLREAEERYRTIANLVDESIYIIGKDRTVLFVNPCAAEILGIKPDDIAGRPFDAVLPAGAKDAMAEAFDQVFRTKKPFRKTSRFDLPGGPVWLDTSLMPFWTRRDEVGGIVGISRNITIRVLLEQAAEREGISRLEKNMEEFQVLNDHIRNPLQIIAALTNLDAGPNAEKILAQVAIIDELVTRLDKGWVESEKIRSFLLRHYKHGEKIDLL